MLASTLLWLFEFEDPMGGTLKRPVDPPGKRFGVRAESPGKPYMVNIKLREEK